MNKVYIAPEARTDLRGIRRYNSGRVAESECRGKYNKRHFETYPFLETFAEAGVSLSGITGFDTAYRFLVYGNYLAFYKTVEDAVFVDRVLYGRRDYMRILFGEIANEYSQMNAMMLSEKHLGFLAVAHRD